MKPLYKLLMMSVLSVPFLTGAAQRQGEVLSYRDATPLYNSVTEVFTTETVITEQTFTLDDLLGNIKNFVDTPEGGVSWQVFGQTAQHEYSYTDEHGMESGGVRPEFSDALKAFDGKEILIQGYMFPLGQEEKQSSFLFGPFPLSCPFHYHVTPNLIIEVHAKTSITFSYDPINITGSLELVPQDDEYNVFYRLKNAVLVKK